jgi:hypothetical protein
MVIWIVYELIMTSADQGPSGSQDDVTDLIERLRRTEALLERAATGQSLAEPANQADRQITLDQTETKPSAT